MEGGGNALWLPRLHFPITDLSLTNFRELVTSFPAGLMQIKASFHILIFEDVCHCIPVADDVEKYKLMRVALSGICLTT